MIKSKIFRDQKSISHYFFNRLGGTSKGIYKSLNCGKGSKDKITNISKNLQFSKKADIFYRIKRLIDEKYMGSLFKVLFVSKSRNNFNLGFK